MCCTLQIPSPLTPRQSCEAGLVVHPNFTDEENRAERFNHLPKIPQLPALADPGFEPGQRPLRRESDWGLNWRETPAA